MKKLKLITFWSLIILLGCTPEYVAEIPADVEIEKPVPPNSSYMWIDNGWVYNKNTNTYIRSDGVWVQPKQGSTFISGSWESNKKGYYWKKGRWQKAKSEQ